MSRLYVANVSRKEHVICYRLDIDKEGQRKDSNRRFQGATQQNVPAGRQVLIGGDFHMSQIEHIVDQLSRYGMIGVVDVPRIDNHPHELIFNIDKPVPAAVMERVRDHNSGVLVGQGRDLRRKAAVATNEAVQKVVAEQFAMQGIPADPVDKVDVTFEQMDQSDLGEKRIEEGYHVEPAPAAPRVKRPYNRKPKN
jgi:hypothetical protein